MTNPQAKEILDFWFSKEIAKLWFSKDQGLDDEIWEKFFEVYKLKEKLGWDETPENSLAKVILFDQFPRNMFRDTPKAYDTDAYAREIARVAIEKGWDERVEEERRNFFYMPFMHSEQKDDQAYCLELFKKLGNEGGIKYAKMHQKIIKRFGRFPHRNKILERESTAEEKEFLTEAGSSF